MPMPELPDQILLDFNRALIWTWEQDRADQLLSDHPVLYRNHLGIAIQLDEWAAALAEPDNLAARASGRPFPDYVNALREVAAKLRMGEYLP